MLFRSQVYSTPPEVKLPETPLMDAAASSARPSISSFSNSNFLPTAEYVPTLTVALPTEQICSSSTVEKGSADMAVYIADKIEPGRRDYPTLERVRTLAQLSLERATLTSMEGTLIYVRKSGKTLHPATLETIAWLREEMGSTPDEHGYKPKSQKSRKS